MATREDMEKVARAMGVSPTTVRMGLEQRVLPFGAAIKCNRQYSYVFFPAKVERYLGIRVGRNEKEEQ